MDIYREEILEHWRNPQNFGEMDKPDLVVKQVNPLCGDKVTFFFKIRRGRIVDAKFIGNGCAISVASSSILSEAIKGKSLGAIKRITGQDVLGFIGGKVTPARLKCAFLSLEAVKKVNAN